jgi:transcriptional regulator with XRE-family HTH domain
MLLAKRIRMIRKQKMKTQEEICQIIGITQPAYSQYENEAANMTFGTIIKIAEALEVPIPFLTDIYSEHTDYDAWRNDLQSYKVVKKFVTNE